MWILIQQFKIQQYRGLWRRKAMTLVQDCARSEPRLAAAVDRMPPAEIYGMYVVSHFSRG